MEIQLLSRAAIRTHFVIFEAMEYASREEFRAELEKIGKGVAFRVTFHDSLGFGFVSFAGRRLAFRSDRTERGFRLNDDSHGCLIREFGEARLRQKNEADDFRLCQAMLVSEDHTKIWYEGSKFMVESENSIYKSAKSATELIEMIGNVKGRTFQGKA
jgi:hypothetical protein